MGLISRITRGSRNTTRPRAAPKAATAANKNRRQKRQWKKPPFPFTFKGLSRVLRWAGTLCLCLAVAGVITVGLLYGYRYVTNSSYFAVKTLEVEGNFRLTSREVLEIAGLQKGMNALLVSIDGVERSLAGNPWVKAVSVKRVLPDGFFIRVTEKEPLFWIRRGGVLYYADAMGEPIVKVSPGRFASLPTLEVEAGAENLTARLPELLHSLVAAQLAEDMTAITRVRLSPGRGVEVSLRNDRLVLSIGHEEWRENLNRLAATLADVARRGEMKEIREVRVHGPSVWVIKKGPVGAASSPERLLPSGPRQTLFAVRDSIERAPSPA